MKKIHWLWIVLFSLNIFSLTGQTKLGKAVISNGGQVTSNNVYRLNLSIGQSLGAKLQTESSEACVGFWYEVTGITTKPFVLEKYKVVEKVDLNQPGKRADLKIYPNPFFDKTQIEFQLAESGRTRLCMIDIQGKEVDLLMDEYMTNGRYKITYQSHAQMNGVYTLMLITDRERLHKSCIILK